jgi:hypothetical protein
MHTPSPESAQFKRQVVFRISAQEWPLLEEAAVRHGSIQAALLAGLRALSTDRPASVAETADAHAGDPRPVPAVQRRSKPAGSRRVVNGRRETQSPNDELTAREAAALLGLASSTVKGYIRRGRIKGRYDESPTWRGWVMTRRELERYRRRRRRY